MILKVEKAFLLDPLAATFSRSLIHIFLPHGPFKFPPENVSFLASPLWPPSSEGSIVKLLILKPILCTCEHHISECKIL